MGLIFAVSVLSMKMPNFCIGLTSLYQTSTAFYNVVLKRNIKIRFSVRYSFALKARGFSQFFLEFRTAKVSSNVFVVSVLSMSPPLSILIKYSIYNERNYSKDTLSSSLLTSKTKTHARNKNLECFHNL